MTKDDPIAAARAAIVQCIADLRAANIPVPSSLHRAAHALSYAVASDPDKPVMPACHGQGPLRGDLMNRVSRLGLPIHPCALTPSAPWQCSIISAWRCFWSACTSR